MEKLHHANIIIGKNNYNFVFDVLENQLNFKTQGNPDFLLLENLNFGIDDARNFKAWVIGKPFTGEVKVAILSIKSITHEAQNALLKVLEEPPTGTYIFIQIESLGGILPTFISRVRVFDVSKENFNTDSSSEFLNNNVKKRFSIINNFAKKVNKDEIQRLIKNLEETAYKTGTNSLDLKNILKAKIFANIRGSSSKMLLEWLACMIK